MTRAGDDDVHPAPLRVLIAPDKFRGTLSARQAAVAMAAGVREAYGEAGARCRILPLADGGEGTVEAFGGPNRSTTVTGPGGGRVAATWRLDGRRAVIEAAAASGLAIVGGRSGNDPMAATTRGTGEVIAAAIAAGARDILIGVGGSATTDGGSGALEVLAPGEGPSIVPADARLTVCADVRTGFLDAARVFAPQKGAGPAQVRLLTERLERLRTAYLRRFGIDVAGLEHAGAAGGLAGGLAAIGARLVPGFAAIADAVGFDAALADSDLVITGEGRVDPTSLQGKVVGEVAIRAARAGVPALVVCGQAAADVSLPAGATLVSLAEATGLEAALADPEHGITRAVGAALRGGRIAP